MKKLFFVLGSFFVLSLGVSVVAPQAAFAVDADYCKDAPADSAICTRKDDDLGNIWGVIINTLIIAVAIISTIVIIIGGLRYTLSGGDQKAVSDAKNTILYAVIALVIAFSSYAIINWVVGAFDTTSSSEGRPAEDDVKPRP